MRHIFDQYSQPENRLTHALISGLDQDRRLLKEFVEWATGKNIFKGHIYLLEQSLPGEEEIQEEEAQRRGLPDAWIYTEDDCALLIESKISSTWSLDQLRRHFAMAYRRGFKNVHLLALGINSPKFDQLKEKTYFKPWRDVYGWMIKRCDSSRWALNVAQYMEIAEVKMVQEKYLRAGTLTKFSGIPFHADHHYTYLEAKRILELLLKELRKDQHFVKIMKIDPLLAGRGAIRGRKTPVMWDCLRVQESKEEKNFTSFPHLTVYIRGDFVGAYVTVPHGVKRSIRRKIISLDKKGLLDIINEIVGASKKLLKVYPTAKPYIELLQRHYPSQSSPSILDARLKFDLRTVLKKKRGAERYQPQWLSAGYEVMKNRRSNLQFAIGFDFPLESSEFIKTEKAIDIFKEAFYALRPFLNIILNRRNV